MNETMPWNNNKTTTRPIGWFVLLSLALHVLLFWGILPDDKSAPLLSTAQQPANGLHVTLAPYQVPMKQGDGKSRNQPATVNNAPAVNSQQTAQVNNDKTATSSKAGFRERVISKLRKSLETHFVYPLMARQRNWQGEVLLAFRLERDGSIRDARVARSSGYGLLDHAALNALAQIGRLGEILPDSLSVELPVIYRLEG